MSFAAVLPSSLAKEVRALALPWVACLACMVVPAAIDAPRFLGGISIPAYFFGTAALGALSIGHEYTGRTLSLFLSLPARRERLLAVKLGVLAATLLILWYVASSLVFGIARAPRAEQQMAALLPALCGLFVAPWLTMACRNPIAGTVFTLTIPGVLLVAGELIGIAKYGHGPVMEAFRMAFVWYGTLGFCAIGGVMSWFLFKRLEAIHGPGQDMRLPHWLRSGNAARAAAAQLTKYNPVWLLVKKELRLQQLPLVLAALYALVWTTAAWSTTLVSDSGYSYALGTATVLYAGLLSMLVGSSASAGERQIGTLEWQVLLPIAAWKQWAVKVGVVWGLAMLLALGLPAALLSVSRLIRVNAASFPQMEPATIAVTLLATGSLYVSSLCRSGLWALLMSIPAVVGSAMFLQLAFEWLGNPAYAAARRLASGMTPILRRPVYFMPPRTLTLLLIVGFIAIVLRFALTNHRSADRAARRVWTQVILMAAFVAAGVITGAAWQAFRR